MKYEVQFTNQFKKDVKLAKKQNKNLDKLFEVIDILANGGTLMPDIEITISQVIIKVRVSAILSQTGFLFMKFGTIYWF